MLAAVRALKSVEIPRAAADVILVTAFAAATALSAFVRVPLPGTPVPFTLQVFMVLFGALCMGRMRGAASQAIYLGAGAAGVPIFANAGAGLAYFAGPTGGYLVGFVLAALIAGRGAGKAGLRQMIAASLCGAVVILTCGTLHLALVIGKDLETAFLVGFLPFIIPDSVKAVAAAFCAWRLRERWGFPS